jgi:glycerol kinase
VGLLRDFNAVGSFPAEPAIARGLAFVPALAGLACPHWDRQAGALWIGMSPATTSADLCQSILEGVALRTAEVIRAMHRHVGVRNEIQIDGGLSVSAYFAQFLADVSRRTIVVKTSADLAVFGCAALAAREVGQEIRMPANAAMYTPCDVPFETWIDRFDDAVARARKWRE